MYAYNAYKLYVINIIFFVEIITIIHLLTYNLLLAFRILPTFKHVTVFRRLFPYLEFSCEIFYMYLTVIHSNTCECIFVRFHSKSTGYFIICWFLPFVSYPLHIF